jgi:hypothetical protein
VKQSIQNATIPEIIRYRESAVQGCLAQIKYSMNILDKLANYSPTFFNLVRGEEFERYLKLIRQGDRDQVPNSALTSEKEETVEISQSTDAVRLWLQLSTQWIHLFQGLRSNDSDQQTHLFDFFKIPCTFTRVIPPNADNTQRISVEEGFECSGLDKDDSANMISQFQGVNSKKANLNTKWEESGQAKTHCECTMSLECVRKGTGWVDVGVSKKCCYLCNLWIQAFNSHLDNTYAHVAVRSYHGKIYQWSPPMWTAASDMLTTSKAAPKSKAVTKAAREANREVLRQLATAMRNSLLKATKATFVPDTGTSGDEFIKPDLKGTEYAPPPPPSQTTGAVVQAAGAGGQPIIANAGANHHVIGANVHATGPNQPSASGNIQSSGGGNH